VTAPRVPVGDVFRVALRLGLTSFGGPIAHLGYFQREYVDRLRWIDRMAFADLVALCQALPGPASSQLGIAIGTTVAGRRGGLAAWLGFTAPSAVAMLAFAAVSRSASVANSGWIHGLELAAVAVVAVAVVTMARTAARDLPRVVLALAGAGVALAVASPTVPPLAIVTGGIVGALVLRREPAAVPRPAPEPVDEAAIPRGALGALGTFVLLLAALPLVRALDGHAAALADTFYRSGSLVFGGGHVVLPLLHAGTVDPGWVSDPDFVAGYGAAQAVPGPLFSFAAYLGAVSRPEPNGIAGGLIALVAIFLPSFLLVFGVLPAWSRLRSDGRIRSALDGAAAVVVGLVLAALIDPVATTGLRTWPDVALAAVAGVAVASRAVPVIVVVGALALAGQLGG
jgi:chromate transporter